MYAPDMLRAKARAKRDAAVSKAIEQYRKELRRIKELHSSLRRSIPRTRRQYAKRRPLWLIIVDVVRAHGPITVPETIAKLRRSYTRRNFYPVRIRQEFARIEDRGLLVRLRRVHNRVLWVAADYDGPSKRYDMWTLREVARDIIGDCGPMRDMDLLIEMRQRDYRCELAPRRQLSALRKELLKFSKVFRRDDDGRWRALIPCL